MKLKSSLCKLATPEDRLYKIPVPIIGLTGGIATGKSTVAKYLEEKGFPLICADSLVKSIYRQTETLVFIAQTVPGVLINDKTINFPLLRTLFFSNPELKVKIQDYLYQKLPQVFLENYQAFKTAPFIIYDVPLLFEKKLERYIDVTILVYANQATQRARIQNRDKTDMLIVDKILAEQLSIETKRERAQFIIENMSSLSELYQRVDSLCEELFEE